MKVCRAVAVCLVTFAFVGTWLPSSFAVDAVEASSVINEAYSSLNSVFAVVVEAESAGADIGGLLVQLRDAGAFLSEANSAFREENYEVARSLAMECIRVVEGVAPEVVRLAEEAEIEKTDSLILAVVGSSIGLVLLLVLGTAGWSYLKKRFYGRFLEMKPKAD